MVRRLILVEVMDDYEVWFQFKMICGISRLAIIIRVVKFVKFGVLKGGGN